MITLLIILLAIFVVAVVAGIWLIVILVRTNQDLRQQVEDHRSSEFGMSRHITDLNVVLREQEEKIRDMALAIVMVFEDKSRELASAHRYIGRLLEEKVENRRKLRLVRDDRAA